MQSTATHFTRQHASAEGQPSRQEAAAGCREPGIQVQGDRPSAAAPGRLISLDVFRGLTMFLLMCEASGLNAAILESTSGTFHTVAQQLTHHPWHGLRLWDLIQPFFMFIVGVAMPFSYSARWSRGDSWIRTFGHAVRRSAILLAFGLMLSCSYSGALSFQLWNVLAQLSVTCLIAFLMMRWSAIVQIAVTIALLAMSELLYRLWSVPGFDQPFEPGRNFGSFIDTKLIGYTSGGHWVTFNCIPTTAHTMWGVLAGWTLLSDRTAGKKLRLLIGAGAAALIAGYALDPVTPIVKRICTSSFVLVSGGWSLLTLAAVYGLVDVLKIRRPFMFAMGFGANALLIYLFSQTAGEAWFKGFIEIFTKGFFGGMGDPARRVLTSLTVLGIEAFVLLWMYRRRIFVRI
ncbi:MAG: acyltransferase family protein [Planctomycetaceae bacterium]